MIYDYPRPYVKKVQHVQIFKRPDYLQRKLNIRQTFKCRNEYRKLEKNYEDVTYPNKS